MLSREFRLPATTRLSRSAYVKTELFSVKYTGNGLPISRFAFVVRKSVDKRAVVRNRVRRVFRSCIEELLSKIVPGYDMLFFLEKGIIDKQQQALCQEIQIFFEQRQLLS